MVSVHDVMTFWIAQGVTMAMNARDIAAQERDVDSHASLSSSIWKKIGVLLCKEMSFENEIVKAWAKRGPSFFQRSVG